MKKLTRFQKAHLAVLLAMILVFGAVTVYNQMHPGFPFRGGLLYPVQAEEGTIAYRGRVKGELVTATISFPTNFKWIVELTAGDRLHDVCDIEYPTEKMPKYAYAIEGVYGIRMTKNNAPLFEGGLAKDSLFEFNGIWFDQDGEPASSMIGGFTIVYSGQDPWEGYETPPILFARLAFGGEEHLEARGSAAIYAVLVLAALLLMVQVAFPEDVFWLRFSRYVKDAEPSDYYMAMARIMSVLLTAMLFAGFCWAGFYMID